MRRSLFLKEGRSCVRLMRRYLVATMTRLALAMRVLLNRKARICDPSIEGFILFDDWEQSYDLQNTNCNDTDCRLTLGCFIYGCRTSSSGPGVLVPGDEWHKLDN